MLQNRMIGSFNHKGLKRLYEDDDRKLIKQDLVERVRTILARLDVAEAIDDLRQPSFRLHALKGDLDGFWAITVRANWRVIFRFVDGAALDVELTDYH